MGQMFEEILDKLRHDPVNSFAMTLLLDRLEEAHQAGDLETIRDLLPQILRLRAQDALDDVAEHNDLPDPPPLTGEEEDYLRAADEEIDRLFTQEEWICNRRRRERNVAVYELRFQAETCRVRLQVRVDPASHLCGIYAILPVTADPRYAYPLCKHLAQLNCGPFLGKLHYDQMDGEVSYRYAYPAEEGVDGKVLGRLIRSTVLYLDEQHERIRNYSVGKFKSREAEAIIEEANALVRDLRGDEA